MATEVALEETVRWRRSGEQVYANGVRANLRRVHASAERARQKGEPVGRVARSPARTTHTRAHAPHAHTGSEGGGFHPPSVPGDAFVRVKTL